MKYDLTVIQPRIPEPNKSSKRDLPETKPSDGGTRKTFSVQGMSCAACATSVESMLGAQPGVLGASVNFAAKTVLVKYEPERITFGAMQKAIHDIGYELISAEGNEDEIERFERGHKIDLRIRTIAALTLAAPVFVIGMTMHGHDDILNWISLALSLPVIVWCGKDFFLNAVRQARRRSTNMDTLVALSTGTAFLFSAFNTIFPHFMHARGLEPQVYFEAAVVIIALILLGRYLEESARERTSGAIKKLIGLQPKTVLVMRDGLEIDVPIRDVVIGEEIVIRPGEKVPVDGIVLQGYSFVDESMISGEPIAVEKTAGASVIAGTINQRGSLTMRAERIGESTLLAQIIARVREAQGSKAPIQKLADKIASIFVPIVISVALLSFMLWYFLGPEPAFTHAVLALVTVLIIACPCALGLATPTAIMVGVGKGAAMGILIKNAESLERAHQVQAIVFDKTGTLTEGRPRVTSISWNVPDEKYRGILFAMESRSEHPLASAVTSELTGTSPPSIESFESITGRGVQAIHDGTRYYIGSEMWLKEKGLKSSDGTDSLTRVYFFDDAHVIAVIGIADAIRPSSQNAIRSLQEMGIEIHLVSGDHERSVNAVARELGISNVVGGALPAGKIAYLKQLQHSGSVVAMVGDGINDAAALAQADVSIALSHGTDIAMEAAHITLMRPDLALVADALRLSQLTVTAIRQNLFWAFVYNIIGIPIAAGVLYPFFTLSPMIAGAAMAMSSVSVVSNSLRMARKKI